MSANNEQTLPDSAFGPNVDHPLGETASNQTPSHNASARSKPCRGTLIDFAGIAGKALTHSQEVVTRWLPDGRIEGPEYVARNPTRDDKHLGSFKVNLGNGKWQEFATGEKGGDLISLVAYIDGVSQKQAANSLVQFLKLETVSDVRGVRSVPGGEGSRNARRSRTADRNMHIESRGGRSVPSDARTATAVPPGVPAPPEGHTILGRYVAKWAYRDPEGRILSYICRFERPDGSKEFRPLTWARQASGKENWRWQALPGQRPLYNLHVLSRHANAMVVVCEGEKAAEAAAQLFPLPDFVTTTAMHGAQSVDKTDWRPLAGRYVLLWPDNDEPGRKCMANVRVHLHRVGVHSVNDLVLDRFARLPNGTERVIPAKWDAADAISEGFTAEHLRDLLGHSNGLSRGTTVNQDTSPYSLVEGRPGMREGLYFHCVDKDGDPMPPLWISSALRIKAVTRSRNGDGWGRLLEWHDRDGRRHVWAAPMAMTVGDGVEFCRTLADRGLDIYPTPQARGLLLRYVIDADLSSKVECTERTGWHGEAFVLPHKTIGSGSEEVVFQSASGNTAMFGERGTLEHWRENIGRLCIGNSRLLMAGSAAFASILLEPMGVDSGGFHITGDSSEGKSSVLLMASSVFGPHEFKRQWNSTTNGAEAIAAMHSGVLLVLDELGQSDPKAAGETAYLLANGAGKQRADRSGGARQRQHWRTLFLSSGEIDLGQHLRDGGKRIRAGQEVRFLTIAANAGKHHGVYEELHEFENGAALSDALRDRTRAFYGTAAIAFIGHMAGNLSSYCAQVGELRNEFLRRYLPKGACGQVHRAADRFALCAAAGELATRLGLTGWGRGEAAAGLGKCLDAWIQHRGGLGNEEQASILAQVRHHFEAHGASRYVDVLRADEHPVVANRAGFRRTESDGRTEYFVLRETFRAELCAGYSFASVTKVLMEHGILCPDKEGKSSQSKAIPGQPRTRVFVIDSGKLAES